MKVSIVTISFNQAPFLEQTLRSVLDQNYGDIEYIVVDPGSTDGSREILERYRPRLAKLILDPDTGPADGLNHGLAAATGEIFAYINSDDMLLPGAVRQAVEAFKRYPKADVIYGHAYNIDESGRIMRRLRSAQFNLRRTVLGSSEQLQQATYYRRESILEVGGFNPENHTCWDYELLVELAQSGKRFRRIDKYWGLFREHCERISNASIFEKKYRRDRARIFENVVGRQSGRFDRIRRIEARLEKWALDPKSFLIAMVDRSLLSTRRHLRHFNRITIVPASSGVTELGGTKAPNFPSKLAS